VKFTDITYPEFCITDPFVTSYIGEPISWIELPDCITPEPIHFTDILNGYLEEYLDLEGVEIDELPIVNVVIEASPDMDIGDEISLMDANGIINFGDCSEEHGPIVVGAGVWMGEPLTIQTYSSFDLCNEGGFQYPGFLSGNQVLAQIWDSSENAEYSADFTWGPDGVLWMDEDFSISSLFIENPTDTVGDVNGDGSLDILDIVMIVNFILGEETFSGYQFVSGDVNNDGAIDVLDVVGMVNTILLIIIRTSEADDFVPGVIQDNSNGISLSADAPVAGIQLAVDGSWKMEEQKLPYGWEIRWNHSTILLYRMEGEPLTGENNLFTYSGNLRIDAVILASDSGNAIPAEIIGQPQGFQLMAAYPNPFNPIITIPFEMTESGPATLEILNIQGKSITQLFSGRLQDGTGKITWDASGQPSGLYFVRMEFDGIIQQQKILLLK